MLADAVHWPLRMSKRKPCAGQLIMCSTQGPPAMEAPACGQLFSMAKNWPPTLNTIADGPSCRKTSLRAPGASDSGGPIRIQLESGIGFALVVQAPGHHGLLHDVNQLACRNGASDRPSSIEDEMRDPSCMVAPHCRLVGGGCAGIPTAGKWQPCPAQAAMARAPHLIRRP